MREQKIMKVAWKATKSAEKDPEKQLFASKYSSIVAYSKNLQVKYNERSSYKNNSSRIDKNDDVDDNGVM